MKKEKKLNNSVIPVSISGTKTILNQLMNCICKLKINNANGTGFFCKVEFGKNEKKIFLMTNYHLLDKNYCDNNTQINLLINDEKEIKTIDLRVKRNNYFNKENDITLIELNKNDNIKNFLELDDNLFRHNNKILYENKSLYILQYPQGRNASVSYGLLSSIDNNEIKHICSTENGSSGSPILNLETNKVIGIHKEGSIHFEFNKGTFLKYPLIDFIQKNKNKIEINQNSIIHNISNMNIQNNITNYNNMDFNNFNMGVNNNINQMNNFSNWTIIDNFESPNNFQINSNEPINVIFNFKGITKILILNPNTTTVDEMLFLYLKKMNATQFYGQNNKIGFLYNNSRIQFGDKTPISKLGLGLGNNQKIIVYLMNLLAPHLES